MKEHISIETSTAHLIAAQPHHQAWAVIEVGSAGQFTG